MLYGYKTPAFIHVGNELGLETVISLAPPGSSQGVMAGMDVEVSDTVIILLIHNTSP